MDDIKRDMDKLFDYVQGQVDKLGKRLQAVLNQDPKRFGEVKDLASKLAVQSYTLATDSFKILTQPDAPKPADAPKAAAKNVVVVEPPRPTLPVKSEPKS